MKTKFNKTPDGYVGNVAYSGWVEPIAIRLIRAKEKFSTKVEVRIDDDRKLSWETGTYVDNWTVTRLASEVTTCLTYLEEVARTKFDADPGRSQVLETLGLWLNNSPTRFPLAAMPGAIRRKEAGLQSNEGGDWMKMVSTEGEVLCTNGHCLFQVPDVGQKKQASYAATREAQLGYNRTKKTFDNIAFRANYEPARPDTYTPPTPRGTAMVSLRTRDDYGLKTGYAVYINAEYYKMCLKLFPDAEFRILRKEDKKDPEPVKVLSEGIVIGAIMPIRV